MAKKTKKKKVTRRKKPVKKAASSVHSAGKGSMLKTFFWGLLFLVLKVVGLAFIIQGFILQLATGVLYYGMLHYAIGVILVWLAWHSKYRCC